VVTRTCLSITLHVHWQYCLHLLRRYRHITFVSKTLVMEWCRNQGRQFVLWTSSSHLCLCPTFPPASVLQTPVEFRPLVYLADLTKLFAWYVHHRPNTCSSYHIPHGDCPFLSSSCCVSVRTANPFQVSLRQAECKIIYNINQQNAQFYKLIFNI